MAYIVFLWLFFRLATSLGVLAATIMGASSFEIFTSPSIPLIARFYEIALAPWLHWDVNGYLDIVKQGYSTSYGLLQFHPLYPIISRIGVFVGLSPLFSLLVISSLSSFLFLIVYFRLARLDLTAEESKLSLLLLGFFPISFILFAPYPESLFLLCSGLCFLKLRQKKWWLAGIAGGLAALTRQQGLLLVLPIAWEAWEIHRPSWRKLLRPHPAWAAIGLTAGGYLAWIAFRRIGFNEQLSGLTSINDFIYSFFISPTAAQVVPNQSFRPPWQPIWLAIQQYIARPSIDLTINLSLAIWFLLALGFGWKGMTSSYRLYSLIITLLSLSYYTGPIHPLMGLPRHLYLAFPVFIGITPRLKAPVLRLAWVGLGVFGYFVLILGYSKEAWVP